MSAEPEERSVSNVTSVDFVKDAESRATKRRTAEAMRRQRAEREASVPDGDLSVYDQAEWEHRIAVEQFGGGRRQFSMRAKHRNTIAEQVGVARIMRPMIDHLASQMTYTDKDGSEHRSNRRVRPGLGRDLRRGAPVRGACRRHQRRDPQGPRVEGGRLQEPPPGRQDRRLLSPARRLLTAQSRARHLRPQRPQGTGQAFAAGGRRPSRAPGVESRRDPRLRADAAAGPDGGIRDVARAARRGAHLLGPPGRPRDAGAD